jgi:hypothetical protein
MKENTRVLKNRIMIGAAAAAAAIVPIAGVSALAASPAGAAPKGITCTTVSGTANATSMKAKLSFSGCTPTKNTGGSGTSSGKAGATKGTITWKNKKTTAFSETLGTGTNCAAGNLADELVTGTVTSDTSKATAKGAAVNGEICANAVGSKIVLSNAPGVPFTFAP